MFSLITGYSDPPAGVALKGNLSYNKYFPGGAIAMARNLYDGLVEYQDGTSRFIDYRNGGDGKPDGQGCHQLSMLVCRTKDGGEEAVGGQGNASYWGPGGYLFLHEEASLELSKDPKDLPKIVSKLIHFQ